MPRFRLLVPMLVIIVAAPSLAAAQDFNNWGEFAPMVPIPGGTPVPLPPRCYPKGSASPTGPDPAAQAGTAIGTTLGKVMVNSFQAGLTAVRQARRNAALRQQEISNEEQVLANRVAAGQAAQNQRDALQQQEAVARLRGALKSLDDDPQMGGRAVSAQLNPGARTSQARALAPTQNQGAIPASTALGQLAGSGGETTGRLFDGGVTPTDATPTSKMANLTTPTARSVGVTRSAVFPGLSSSDWSKLLGSKDGQALIKQANELLTKRDAVDAQINSLKQTSGLSPQQQQHLIAAINQQTALTGQISSLQPAAQTMINRTVLDP